MICLADTIVKGTLYLLYTVHTHACADTHTHTHTQTEHNEMPIPHPSHFCFLK